MVQEWKHPAGGWWDEQSDPQPDTQGKVVDSQSSFWAHSGEAPNRRLHIQHNFKLKLWNSLLWLIWFICHIKKNKLSLVWSIYENQWLHTRWLDVGFPADEKFSTAYSHQGVYPKHLWLNKLKLRPWNSTYYPVTILTLLVVYEKYQF